LAKKASFNGERYADNSERLLAEYTGVKAVRPVQKAFRGDGNFQNLMTKYGTSKDASEYYTFVPDSYVPDSTMSEFYEQNGIFARVIDAPAEEAVKHGFELEGLEDDTIQNFADECLDELDWEETAMQSLKWARLFGGSIAVLLINDGGSLEEPVNWKKIKSIDDIRVFDRSVITPDYESMYKYENRGGQDPFRTRGSRLGYPEWFHVSSRNGTFDVHETRCLIFQNGVLPENTTSSMYQFWGIPEYIRVNRAIRDVEVAHGMAPKMLDRSVQAIYKMTNLASLLATEQGEEVVLKRLQTIDLSKGLTNSMILDADGEDYDFKSFSYSGVSDVINTTCNYLSAITNIPQTILFGRSPAGMNATGASDLENYYNYVERIQKRMLRSNLRYLLSVIFQAGKHTGEIKRVPKINVKFNSLWSMTETEQVALDMQKAQVESTKAQTAAAYVQMQAIDPSEVRQKLADEGEFDIETMLDDYTEEELEENAPQQQQEGGGDPMAALMGGGGGGENPLAAMMGGGQEAEGQPEGAPQKAPQGMPQEAPQEQKETPQQQKPVAPAQKVAEQATQKAPQPEEESKKEAPTQEEILKKMLQKKKSGNSPDAAPEATKLPEDMDFEEEVNKDSEAEVSEEPEEEPKEQPVEEPEQMSIWDKLEIKKPEDEKPRGGVGVLIMQGNKILTGTRIDGDAKGAGLICGPGGHIELLESPLEAACRETEEEFGIRPLGLKELGVIKDEDENVGETYIFVATSYEGEPDCDDEEMREPVWRDLDELANMEDLLFKPFRWSLRLLIEELYREDGDGNPYLVTAEEAAKQL